MQKLSISLTPDDETLIQELVRRFGLVRRHAVCRAALRAGLAQFDRDQAFAHDHLTQEVQGPTTGDRE